MSEQSNVDVAVCRICNGEGTVYDKDGDERACPCQETGVVDIISLDGKVHSRRSCSHRDVAEALEGGYMFRPAKLEDDAAVLAADTAPEAVNDMATPEVTATPEEAEELQRRMYEEG